MKKWLWLSIICFSLLTASCRSRIFNNPFDPHAESGIFIIRKVIPLATCPRDLTFSSDALWMVSAEGNLIAISYIDGTLLKRIDLNFQVSGVTYDRENLWVSAAGSSRLYQLNSLNGSIIRVLDAPFSKLGVLAFEDNRLFAHDIESNSIYKIDLLSGRTEATLKFPALRISGLFVQLNTIYLLDQSEGKIFHYKPNGELIRSFLAPGVMARGLTAQEDFFWCADSDFRLYQFSLL